MHKQFNKPQKRVDVMCVNKAKVSVSRGCVSICSGYVTLFKFDPQYSLMYEDVFLLCQMEIIAR